MLRERLDEAVGLQAGTITEAGFNARLATGDLITKSFFCKKGEIDYKVPGALYLLWVYFPFYVISTHAGLLGASF